ncbi:TonB-dependent receptor [Aurantibacter sp.]|uniref:TonB-dependent receptor n=1 Tax=Aurantibacter sp. TaxID=2807103 RepID=UPI00326464D6
MKKIIMLFIAVINITVVFSQNSLNNIIRDSETNEPLMGATVILEGTTNGVSSDMDGYTVLKNIPNGEHIIVFSYIGYETRKKTFNFPISATEPIVILLKSSSEHLEEVIIQSTRSSRTIDNVATRVETISGEELEEKGNMKPGDIRMLLNESTGIQTQQTSATSYNSSIRIQGLDGKYTQILRDGLPLYSGFSGGLSLMQIAPLDLQQVEVIKGASSTLYGGGAISGLVNLISKMPKEEREISFVINGTSALGLDLSGFYSQKFKKFGTTIFASYNLGSPYDPADIGLTAIPKFNRYTINPKFYFYLNDQTTLNIGFNNTAEDRIGGDIKYIEGNGSSINTYFEENKTNRFSTQFGINRIIDEKSKFALKNSVSYYDRNIEIPDFEFSGIQLASFSEANYNYKNEKLEWIGGLNLWTDKFTQSNVSAVDAVDYNYTTVGAFVQNTWNPTEKFILETGLRGDYQNEYGFFLLPRISALYKLNEKFSTRIGGGLGYKTPTVFTEDAERIQFNNVLPLDVSNTNAEESIGTNIDVNYKTALSDKSIFTINALFFYTQVKDPIVLTPILNNAYEFQQPDGYIDTKGVETNTKITYGDFKLFVGYTYADVNQHYNGTSTTFPLVARHRLNNVLMYEVEEKLKMGLEAYYFSPQKLNDGTTGKQYWLTGFMVEKLWENFSIFVNFENFIDTRQTKFDSIYTGTITNPTFQDIYAPVDGFVVNGGIKLKF